MRFLLQASLLFVLFFMLNLTHAEENPPVATTDSKETALPPVPEEKKPRQITLQEAIKQVMQDDKNKILTAKTELLDGKKIHVIKVLTSTGYIQYIKIDAASGEILNKPKK